MIDRRLWVALWTSMAALPATVAAQGPEATDTLTQRLCASWNTAILAGSPDSLVVAAKNHLSMCEITGPPTIARMWSTVANSSLELNRLFALSTSVRDKRILDSLVVAARRTGLAEPIRMAALATLAAYFDPRSHFASIDGPRTGVVGNRLPVLLHYDTTPGAVPLPASTRPTVAAVFRDLANGDPEPTVQAAALFLRQAAYYIAPSATPIDANSIRLTYLCGNRFRLRNYNNIELEVRYDVYSTSEARSLFPKARSTPPGYSELVFTTKNRGTVRVFYNQQLVQTKANGNKAC